MFTGQRKVRLGDVDPEGRLRLDALTRYTQDVSDDDTTDAGLDSDPGWVVRSTVVDELAPAELGDQLRFETFCSGLGGRWAERRLTVSGDGSGIHYEVATLWVCIDAQSGRPHRLTDQFQELYGEAAGDRKISARQVNPPLSDATDAWPRRSWQVRRADLDVYGHVNNAAYWAAVEQWAAPWSAPRRARLEYGGGLTGVDEVVIVTAPLPAGADDEQSSGQTGGPGLALWWLPPADGAAATDGSGDGSRAGDVVATASVAELPPHLYR